MDSNDNPQSDLLSKYGRKEFPKLVKPEPEEGEESDEFGYRALVEHREKKGNAPRYRIIDRTGLSYGCGYAYLLGWLNSPSGTLSIYTTTHVFILDGKNLHRIEQALMREKVRELREFNPDQDEQPADGEPLIERLSVNNRLAGS
jgi:hypothetical protein